MPDVGVSVLDAREGILSLVRLWRHFWDLWI